MVRFIYTYIESYRTRVGTKYRTLICPAFSPIPCVGGRLAALLGLQLLASLFQRLGTASFSRDQCNKPRTRVHTPRHSSFVVIEAVKGDTAQARRLQQKLASLLHRPQVTRTLLATRRASSPGSVTISETCCVIALATGHRTTACTAQGKQPRLGTIPDICLVVSLATSHPTHRQRSPKESELVTCS
jgi:hypothetical protein